MPKWVGNLKATGSRNSYSIQKACILSVVDAWAVPCPKASFSKKKTRYKWSVFDAQHSLRCCRGQSCLTSTEQLCKCHILQLFKVVEEYLSIQNTISMYLKSLIRASEMAQWLGALAALPEVLSSIPSTHIATHSCLQLQFLGI